MKTFIATIICCSLFGSVVGQVYDDMRHNTNYNDAWISCSALPNPNTNRGDGHWIMYDLRNDYDIFQFTFWNLNDPARLNDGIQEIAIDVSLDGNTWNQMGTYTLPMSDGSSFYTGVNALSLNGATARYVLLTGLSNYGGSCYGLSEVKFGVSEASLPVTLVDFDILCRDSGVTYRWVVNTEYQCESYTCQISRDGINWSDTGTLPGENKLEENTYHFNYTGIDPSVTYYRIVQKDFDGSLTYFPVQRASCFDVDEEFMLTPNPVVNEATLTLSETYETGGSFRINDINGKRVKSGIINSNYMTLQLSDLTAGTYFITIDGGNILYREKFIKL